MMKGRIREDEYVTVARLISKLSIEIYETKWNFFLIVMFMIWSKFVENKFSPSSRGGGGGGGRIKLSKIFARDRKY